MLETSDSFIFTGITIVRSAIQEYSEGKMRKSPKAIKELRFTGDEIELRDEHEGKILGKANNFIRKGLKWVGDVFFAKKHMTEDQIEELRTLKKRDVSVGFSYVEVASDNEEFFADQTEIIVDHLAWVLTGRCSYPSCGLDSKTTRKTNNDVLILTPDCDDRLKANDSAHKTLLDAKNNAFIAKDKELTEFKKHHDAVLKTLEKYQKDEKERIIKEIIQKSSYEADSLKDHTLDALNLTLEILSKAKDAKVGFPDGATDAEGNPLKTKTDTMASNFDISKSHELIPDMNKLHAKGEGK